MEEIGQHMAQEGMNAAQTPLEGVYGFVSMYTRGNPPDKAFTRLTRGLGDRVGDLKGAK